MRISSFRSANPTGHYILNLAVKIEKMVCSKLVEAALYEGQFRTWRNVRMNGKNIHEWLARNGHPEWDGASAPQAFVTALPNFGTVELDYTSYVEPGSHEEPLTGEALGEMLQSEGIAHRVVGSLMDPSSMWTCASPAYALCLLREASVNFWITAEQAVRLIHLFETAEQHVEAAIILYARILDKDNFYKVTHCLDCFEQVHLGVRLGWPNVLNMDHCTGRYRLDCTKEEDLEFAKKMVAAAIKEKARGGASLTLHP